MALPRTGLIVAASGNLVPMDRDDAPLCCANSAVAAAVVGSHSYSGDLWLAVDNCSYSPTNRRDPCKYGSCAHSDQIATDSSTDGRTVNTSRSRNQRIP